MYEYCLDIARERKYKWKIANHLALNGINVAIFYYIADVINVGLGFGQQFLYPVRVRIWRSLFSLADFVQ